MAKTDVLVDAERAFASAAASEGTRAAFLQFLNQDSILFRPEPVDGRTWFEQQPDNPGLLSWRPAFAEMAASGDMGYTTGPWHFRRASSSDPVQFGQYMSIWRRIQPSLWKVVLDAGISCPPQVEDSASPQVIAIEHDTLREGASNSELLQVEARMAERARQDGYLAAVQPLAAADVWLLRMGQLPCRGSLELVEMIPPQPMELEWTITGAATATSGDLGYVYGTGRRAKADKAEERFSFLRIWRWGDLDRWELALDLDNPFPEGT